MFIITARLYPKWQIICMIQYFGVADQNLPWQEFHLLWSHVKSLSLFHETEPVKYSKNVRVVEPVSPENIYFIVIN